MTDTGTNKNVKGRLLIIEDEPALADIYATMMKTAGYEVALALDGVDGLEKALRGQPDLIMLDLIMPLKDGFEVLRDLKLNDTTKGIPVIIMSNLGQDFEVKRGLELGAAQFLVKTDIDPATLVDKIGEVLAGSRQEKEKK